MGHSFWGAIRQKLVGLSESKKQIPPLRCGMTKRIEGYRYRYIDCKLCL
jgi:hypothetical protein